ncbi:HD family phosphohydrolase [Stratiformator vulcanicus]|uniref:HD/PDEase domain-containing protein n=1 Tax=Stratiformator vulcanicus TaxID=2527980 RepID=A0A517R6I1_9PLAN|nr:HDIG domain-containing metalloprotein [Stratiformator vulcanicus]QDT39507.1 hypothetical protein Pan189_39150 [Stratiformator vulcanicus]
MPLIPSKKGRSPRSVKLRTSQTAAGRFDALVRSQQRLVQVILVICACVGVVLAVRAERPPFPYRLGDYATHGLAAKVPFRREDEFNTERARSIRAEQVRPIFINFASRLDDLTDLLAKDLRRVLSTERLENLPEDTAAAFGLTELESTAVGQGGNVEARREFDDLKSAAGRDPEAIEDGRLERILADFEEIVDLFRRTGITTPEELASLNIQRDGLIAVYDRAGEKVAAVAQNEIVLADLLQETGKVGEALVSKQSLKLLAPFLKQWMLRLTPVTLSYDSLATQLARQEARESVDPVYDQYNPRDILVEPGTRISEQELTTLRAEYDSIVAKLSLTQSAARTLTVIVMVAVLAVLNGYYLVKNEPLLVGNPVSLAVYLAATVLAIWAARVLSFDPWRAEIIPLVAVVMLFAITYNQVLATITAFTLTSVVVLSTTADLSHFILLMSVCAAAIIPLAEVSSRSKIIKIGVTCGLVYFVVSFGLGLLERQNFQELRSDTMLLSLSLQGAFWCVVTGYLVAGSLPFIESVFGVVTDISLLEMSDVSHPLLQELVRRAPGTYNHSIAVATIGETAADAIGANGLLVRVGAYFHDVGKMLKPQYFIENMSEGTQSRHEQLAPAMSTLIIIGHVKDGVDLARDHNVPERIIDFIEQHHGTTLVEYFYREAAKHAEQSPDHRGEAEESAFRYPGPKPQSREAGVMMLSDAVESASRTLSEPTPKRLESLVHSLTMKRLLDGQFDESSLTLSEINRVQESLTKSLIGIYHGRIKYPEQKSA